MLQQINATHTPSAGDSGGKGRFVADALLSRALMQAGVGAWACDLADSTLSWTPGVFELFGLPPSQRLDRREIVALYEEESRCTMERLRGEAIVHGRPFSMEAQIVRPDGDKRWMRLNVDVVREHGRVTRLFGLKQDITQERRRWEDLRRLAEHDAMTGLANRMVFDRRFLNASQAQPGIAPLGALVLIDLDHFKQINDRFGHGAGDACLQAAAQRLATAFADAPLVARIGGDEFAVLMDDSLTARALERRVAHLLSAMARPVEWRGQCLPMGGSAGIALAQDPYRYDAQALFSLADKALYAAKLTGRGRMVTIPGPGPATARPADDGRPGGVFADQNAEDRVTAKVRLGIR